MRWVLGILSIVGVLTAAAFAVDWFRPRTILELPADATEALDQEIPLEGEPFAACCQRLRERYIAMDDRFRAMRHTESKVTFEESAGGGRREVHREVEEVWFEGNEELRRLVSESGRNQNPLVRRRRIGSVSRRPVSEELIYPFSRRSAPGDYHYRFEGYETLGDRRVVRIGFEPHPPVEKKLRGYVWADRETLEPVRFDGLVMKSPAMFVDSVRYITEYGDGPDGKQQIRRMVFEGAGGFAFLRRRGRMEVDVTDYQPLSLEP